MPGGDHFLLSGGKKIPLLLSFDNRFGRMELGGGFHVFIIAARIKQGVELLGHPAEFKLFEQCRDFFGVGFRQFVVMFVERYVAIAENGGEFFRHDTFILVGLDRLLHLAFQLMRVFQQVLHRAEFLDQFLGGYFAHTRKSRNVVDRIAHHPQEIDDLLRPFHAKPLEHFGHTPDFNPVAHSRRFIDKDILRHKLRKIFIRRHHEYLIALLFGLLGNRPDKVVGFTSGQFDDWNVHRFENAVDVGDGQRDRFGRFAAVCFIFGVHFRANGTSIFIERDGQMIGLFSFDHIEERIHEPEDRRGIHSF